jgi:diguanylate cyclase (GGDEF)-like protein
VFAETFRSRVIGSRPPLLPQSEHARLPTGGDHPTVRRLSASPRASVAAIFPLLVAAGLLSLAVGASIAEHKKRDREAYHELQLLAVEHSEDVEAYFARSRSLTKLLSLNPSFREFYELRGTRAQQIRVGGRALREARRGLVALFDVLPNAVGEACFIDRSGAENARAVRGRIAPNSQLSQNERGNPFFVATFARPPNDVYQSAPYRSPDTHDLVLANAAVIPSNDGVKHAIVHFEISLASLARSITPKTPGYEVVVVDRRTGAVIVDTAHARQPSMPLGSSPDRRFAQLASTRRKAGTFEVGGRDAAYDRVATSAGNINDWAVAVLPTGAPPSWIGTWGYANLALLAGALLLFFIALRNFRSSQRALRRVALQDSLTGLGNRFAMSHELDAHCNAATRERPILVTVFDLDGFKEYNDNYGHPAGDALLARVGHRLGGAIDGRGAGFRMGGDEFCVILPHDEQAKATLAAAATALSEIGDGFKITCSYGSAAIPKDAGNAAAALRLADARMYSHKATTRGDGARGSAVRQSMEVLARAVAETSAELGDHTTGVAALAQQVGRTLGLSDVEVTETMRAAVLHDVGKIAIPDAVLAKRGPLDDDEWELMRRHTLIGQRILQGAPSLAAAGRLVRSSHERWDGQGYPDRLAGEAIPLGARIIAVCDAFDAMTTDRPYRSEISVDEALEELRRCAGTQFDPGVVAAFCEIAADGVPEFALVGASGGSRLAARAVS